MRRLLPLLVLLVFQGRPASATALSVLIANGQTIQVGDKLFGNFRLTPQSSVAADSIDVVGFTDASGNFGLRFSSAALAIGAGGSNELVADVLFDVRVTDPSFFIHAVNQAFVTNLGAGKITAYDFTSAGPAGTVLPTVASNCINGDVSGCSQILSPTDSHVFAPDVSSLQVERQIQLIRAKGSIATGTVTSWDSTFSQTAVTTSVQAAVTVSTVPAGLSIVVDGATMTAPQTFNWIIGSTHSLSTLSPQGAGGTRSVFASWSDGLAQSHIVTVAPTTAGFVANFTTQNLLTLSASPVSGGTLSAVPPSPDGFYNAGVVVQVSATPAAGFAFSGFSADAVGATSPVSVIMSAPRNITGSFTLNTAPQALQFIPVTPCRVVDTRASGGFTGAFGPPSLSASSWRSIPIPSSSCGIPATAQVYSLNITVIPSGPALGFLSVWPTGQPQPLVSTLNSLDGRVVANAALVPAGTGGAISVFVTDKTDLVIDINGYFVPPNSSSQMFYPLSPCRLLDTRNAVGALGGPSLAAGSSQAFPLQLSSCGIPASARAYSLNVTVVPKGTLGFLTVWPTGQPQPLVSTLNSSDGTVLANAAIVPAGINGSVSFYATDLTDLVVDINGYFAPPGSGGLNFYAVTPCRVADTRSTTGTFGGPIISARQTRAFPMPQSGCALPAAAQAYSLNMTVVPPGTLGYLSVWPFGAPQPVVSTLNDSKGLALANAALVPAGAAGAINAFVTDSSHLIIDVNGYFGQ